MINKEYVKNLLNQILKDDIYLVNIKINNTPKITLFIDSYKGVSIDDCKLIHRQLVEKIKEDTEDFLLEVSSPGLTSQLVVWQQFFKNKDKRVLITTKLDENYECVIEDANEKEVKIKTKDGKSLLLTYETIRKTKPLINF